ncbi:MAG: hypothetical protein ABW051_07280 [Burkholderiaceae bacterium]
MKLGTEALPAAEAGLLRTILRLSSDLAGRWAMAEEGPCEAVLFDDTVAGAREAAAARSAVTVPVLRRGAPRPAADHLERPVRAEDFLALLRSIEAAVAAAAPGSPPALSSVSSPVSSPVRPARAPLPEPESEYSVAPVVRSGIAPSVETLEANIRGRLKRWPPGKLLSTGRGRIELATLLTRQARSAHELAGATRQALQACLEFMAELDRHGLILWEATDAAASASGGTFPVMQPARAPALSAAGAGAAGLLRSIRRRLGLGLT